MKKWFTLIATSLFLVNAQAQCPAGQVEVTIEVETDAYGYETYWELVPSGNGCGNGTLFAGGNTAVGCGGAGAQNQTPGGYGDNLTITEGPWCLTEGGAYDIIWIDDWGDGGLSFTVYVNGFQTHEFDGDGAGNTFTFVANEPPAYDLGITEFNMPIYLPAGSEDVAGVIRNYGSTTITSFDLSWSVDGGTPVTENITGVSIANGQSMDVMHSTPVSIWTHGAHTVTLTVSNPNGNQDEAAWNDNFVKSLEVGDGIPNIIDGYLSVTPTFTVIGTAADDLDNPRDLDFHPILTRNELWVINKNGQPTGGSTVTYYDAGEATQTSEWRRDGNAWHFMSLPTGIAFSDDNGNFATSHGIFDANHDGGDPFTGPSLWSSDPLIYAQPSGGNGSHLDMLHESPQAQGITHESGNRFWLFDGSQSDIVMYDFNEDHGPGNDDHSDGEILRYADVVVQKDPNDHVASHLVLDKETNWLYVVDYGNQRVFRMDITSGTVGGAPTFGPFEPLAQYEMVTGYTYEDVVTSGLVEPSGIDVIGDRMIVSDHSNGDIIIYDISSMPATELGRIQTGDPGIMGVKIGPDGRIWYVNASLNQVARVDGINVGVEEEFNVAEFVVYPNPSNGTINVQRTGKVDATYQIRVLNALGAVVYTQASNEVMNTLNLNLPAGVYSVEVIAGDQHSVQRVIIQ